MSGLWQSNRDLDADIAPCGRCGKDVVLQHDPPCPHGFAACPECGPEAVCGDCRRAAFVELCAGDDYDARKDPFYDHTAPPPVDRIARDGGYYWEGAWVPSALPREGA